MLELHRYIYLDKENIDSLYSQATGSLSYEMINSKEKFKEDKISGEFGIKKYLLSLLPLDAKIGGESKKSSIITESSKYELTAENKLREIIKIIKSKKPDVIFKDLNRATDNCKDNGKSTFVCTKTTFDMPQFFSENVINEVNASRYIVFSRGCKKDLCIDSYIHSDDYFKTEMTKYIMSTSLDKYPNCKGYFSRLSHDAMYFYNFKGKDVPINVFGKLDMIRGIFQIKPYAIWI